jgi:hypothetical protein
MSRERIAAIEVGDDVVFNASWLQTGATITNNGRTVRRTGGTATQLGITRVIRPRDGGRLFLRFRLDFVPANGLLVGVAAPSLLPNVGLNIGSDAQGWSYATDGVIWNGGVPTSTGVAAVAGDVIDLAVDIGAGKLWFGKNGTWIGGGNPAAGTGAQFTNVPGTIYVAVSCYGITSGATLLVDDVDIRSFVPAGFTPCGLLARIATKGFATSPNDTPANTYYDGRVAPDGDPVYRRAISCVLWDRGARTGSPLGDIELINIDGALDHWLGYEVRGMLVQVRLGYEAQAKATFTDVASGAIDRAEVVSEERMRLVLADPGMRIDKPAQATMYAATIPNTALVNQPQPMTLGLVQWIPLPQSDPANLQYPFHDGPNGGAKELRDQGVVITPSIGWSFGTRTDSVGVARLVNPAGRNAAIARGAVTLSSLLHSFDFTQAGNWASDNPIGWVLGFAENATNKITFNGGAQFLCDGSGSIVVMERGTGAYGTNNTLVNGGLYWCEIVATVTAGQLEVLNGGLAATDLGVVKPAIQKATGTMRFGVLCTANAPLRLAVNLAAGVNVTVHSLKLWSAVLIERLPDWLNHLCVTRGGLIAADLDTTSINALSAAAPYALGFFADQAVKLPDLIKQTMDSFCGWSWWTRTNKLRVGRLSDPAVGVPVATFTDVELVGAIGVELDRAPGLSDTVAGQRNYAQHGDGEIAGSVLTTPAAGLLRADYLAKRTGTGVLAATYRSAKGAAPIKTLLTSAGDVQALANLITTLYSVPRYFYTFSAAMDDVGSYTIEPGDVVRVQTDITKRFGLTNGKNLLVVSATSRWTSNLVEFVAWG